MRSFDNSLALGWFVLVVMCSSKNHAQEALRLPLASEQAAGQRSIVRSNYYNVQSGPIYLRVQGDVGVELNDNVNYTQTNRRADLILRPIVQTEMLWPLTGRNSFSFTTGLGYVHYLRTGSLDHPYVAPDSNLAFKIYSGDFVFDIHDRFSAQDNVLQTPSLSGTGNYFQIENASGADGTWCLQNLIVSLGYDFEVVDVLSGPFTSFTHDMELFRERTTFMVTSTDRAGFEMEGGLTDYSQLRLENNTEFAIGPFYETRLTPYLRAKVSVGFVAHSFDPTSYSTIREFDSYYADVALNHQLNKWFDHWLSGGREVAGGTANASLYIHDFASYQANFYALKDTTIGVRVSYDHGMTSGGFDEIFDRIGAGIFARRTISRNLSGNLTYEFWHKSSELYNYSYIQNRLMLGVTYKF